MAKPYSILQAYEAFSTTDDRGSLGSSIGVFSTLSKADVAAQNKGWYGGKGHVKTVTCLRITETGETFKLATEEPVQVDLNVEEEFKQVRSRALGKLSREERIALGLEGEE